MEYYNVPTDLEFTSPNNPHPPSNEYYGGFPCDSHSGDASLLFMALHIPPAAAWPLDNANETLSVDDIISHLSDDPLLGISPLDFFHAPPVVDPPSPVKLSPCKTEIGDEDGSGTSHAPSPASPSPVTSRDSSAPPKRTSPKDKGSPKGRSKPSVAIRRIKREEATSKKVAVPPTHPTFPRRANRTPATYVYDASPLSSETDPDNDEEWKPDDIMISDHEDDSSNSNIGYDEKAIRLAPMGVPLIAPPANAAIAACGGTERQRIRSFAQQREIRNRTADSESAGWIDHGGQFLCKAIIRQASKKGRAKWLPGCEPEVGKPCNQLLGTYQDWERHFSCSQWHQEPDTCRFCAKSLNVRSVERHLSSCKNFKRQFIPELTKLYPSDRSGISWHHINRSCLTRVVRQEQAKAELGEHNAWTPVINRFT